MNTVLTTFTLKRYVLWCCKKKQYKTSSSGNGSVIFTVTVTFLSSPFAEINVTCGKNEMFISIPKKLLRGLDRDHLRLTDLKCGATETPTHFIFHTDLTKCRTKSRHTKDFVIYMNKVEEIPLLPGQIITRVREVEIPFSCYYSNTGVVSAVGLEVKSKKIVLSKKGRGEFVLEMKIFPNNKFLVHYEKKDFPVHLPLRKELFVEVSVDTEDDTLAILAEECFATPDPNPDKSGLSYIFIKDGYKTFVLIFGVNIQEYFPLSWELTSTRDGTGLTLT